MNRLSRSVRWVFIRHFSSTLLWVFVMITVAVSINLVGIRIMGDVNAWSRWLNHHDAYFLAWRLCLYGATAYGWWWMRKRVLRREPAIENRIRLCRTEIAAVLAVLVLEVAVFLRPR